MRKPTLSLVLIFYITAFGASYSPYLFRAPLGLDENSAQFPFDNLLTVERVKLGERLFFDKRLSANGEISCATCHNPKYAFTDGKPVAIGVSGKPGQRNTPTIFNCVFGFSEMWDGRFRTLEEQALGPILHPDEMGNRDMRPVIQRLEKDKTYQEMFHAAFENGRITQENIAKAIASFERTQMSGNSRYDQYETGGNDRALTEEEKFGLRVFRNKGQCFMCHNGFNFTDERFHRLGVGLDKPSPDLGRYLITKRERDKGRFKTPTLREVARTAPYMHDGSLKTLEEVVDLYDKGGLRVPGLDPEIFPLKLTTEEKRALVVFLQTLNGQQDRLGGRP